MKKRINYFVIMLMLLVIPLMKVNALSVSKNEVTIEKGSNQSIELYTNTESEIISVTFTLVYSTYDIPAYFTPASDFDDTNPNSITHEIIFDTAKTGKITIGTININVVNDARDTAGTINIHTATAKTTNGNTINLENQNINVKVGTPKKEKPKSALLTKIESKLVNIELKADVYEYDVEIDKEVAELDLKAIPEDENANIEISNQKIADLKDNKITITVKNGNEEKKYTINVNIKKAEEKIAIDKSIFEEDDHYKGKWIIISIVLVTVLMISLVLNRKK